MPTVYGHLSLLRILSDAGWSVDRHARGPRLRHVPGVPERAHAGLARVRANNDFSDLLLFPYKSSQVSFQGKIKSGPTSAKSPTWMLP